MSEPTSLHRKLRVLGHLRHIPFGMRDRVLRRFADPDAMPATSYTADFFGLVYAGDLARFLDWETYFYGAYEPETLSLIDHLIDVQGSSVCFVDIGANAGQHSLFAARRGVRVIAFEPWAPARAQFEQNRDLNGLDNIDIQPVALADTNGEMPFYAPQGTNTGTGSLLADYNPGNNTDTLIAPVRRGDEMLTEAGIDGPAILKIDVEGAERDVVSGLSKFIAAHRPAIIMEFSEATRRSFIDVDDLRRLFGPDYTIQSIRRVRDRHRLAPFDFDAPQGNIFVSP